MKSEKRERERFTAKGRKRGRRINQGREQEEHVMIAAAFSSFGFENSAAGLIYMAASSISACVLAASFSGFLVLSVVHYLLHALASIVVAAAVDNASLLSTDADWCNEHVLGLERIRKEEEKPMVLDLGFDCRGWNDVSRCLIVPWENTIGGKISYRRDQYVEITRKPAVEFVFVIPVRSSVLGV
ncbi:LOW QUALITY PROTEIN: hypothetical protein NC653_040725 [Populus alba x Populus x berolinensis]|uniref:Uncharacterized protein n=1 Tax=Populus alba x Populus x berolinensis TaxID=444605 RepID=A0AAD6L6R7_9ROSI|nr:LOW QUALITY PROTEIN: hypothetical protein NC653_040725 [Populus alba x Populus x berolinensis]